MTAALDAVHLRRVFGRGRKAFTAVEDVSLSILPGQIHALLGPNGAGKTTTVRMCATLLAPTSGSVTVDGVDAVARPSRARARLGLVLGGDLGFYPRATARQNLELFADVYGVPGSRRKAAVDHALERVGLLSDADRKAGVFSRGMTQRLHLARAILSDPAVLLLDEPTTGLDPDVALQVRDLVRQVADSGTAVLLTSHSMPEVEELADVISVIGAGRVAVSGGVQAVADLAGVSTTTTFTLPARHAEFATRLAQALEQAGVRATVLQRPVQGRWAVTVYWASGDPGTSARGLRELTDQLEREAAARPADLLTRPASLEEAYLALADRLAR